MKNIQHKLKSVSNLLTIPVILGIFLLAGCHTNEGVFVPFVGTSYDYSYLNSLEGGNIGEPLRDVSEFVFEDASL
jgi:hypothetical protein